MKKILFLSTCFALILSAMALADDATTTPPDSASSMQASAPKQAKNRPCLNIAVACENAGYRLSKTIPGKNIWKDCVKPIIAGQTVAGVTAAPADIQACQSKMQQRKMKHMQKQQKTKNNNSTAQ